MGVWLAVRRLLPGLPSRLDMAQPLHYRNTRRKRARPNGAGNMTLDDLENRLLLSGIVYQKVDGARLVIDMPYNRASLGFPIKFVPAVLFGGLGFVFVGILGDLGGRSGSGLDDAIAQLILIVFFGLPALLLGLVLLVLGGTSAVVALFAGPKARNRRTGRVIVSFASGTPQILSEDARARAAFETLLASVGAPAEPSPSA